MEKAGFVQSMDFLQTNNVHIDVIVTDRHPQIQKYIRESMLGILHYYDVWHVAKGMLQLFVNSHAVCN